MSLAKRSIAEAIGTFWLVFGGCGAAVLACGVPTTGIGYVGVALAFGLTVLTMAFAIGHISGCHLNPAVTLGLVAGGRFSAKEAPAYIIAQVIGGIIAAAVLYAIACPDLNAGIGAFATNGWSDSLNEAGRNAFGGKTFGMGSAFLIEMVLTAVFLFVIMGATDSRAPAGFAPIAIGLCLTLIHLISIPVTNTSVNPARSTAVAVFVGGTAIKQLWLFWVAPILGGVIGGVAYKFLACCKCCKCGKDEK
ncbi:MAG: aquaporin Z [Hallerella porci]|uniref:MIP family channel proteins n=1 Tax=Hallerella porci TaxID=1945871 RepID=A0ABX5LN06_9BACT|nr:MULTISPECIES: aquaporin Z [Hallerella]MCI5601478.1 aquaporin Z [Hallerella sp.]MDY3922485.1 aquaporin Z [Hallerella porci]PWL03687.1 MIP family channel proteins [Hallerella porci]